MCAINQKGYLRVKNMVWNDGIKDFLHTNLVLLINESYARTKHAIIRKIALYKKKDLTFVILQIEFIVLLFITF